MFNIGDRVVMSYHKDSESKAVPIGQRGTVVVKGDGLVGVQWDEDFRTRFGQSYTKEIDEYDADRDDYITKRIERFYYVEGSSLELEDSTNSQYDQRTRKIISKIKNLDRKYIDNKARPKPATKHVRKVGPKLP